MIEQPLYQTSAENQYDKPIPTKRWIPISTLAIGAGAALFIWANNPQATTYAICPVKLLTGFDCPGCGATRCIYALLHGNVLEAFNQHAMLALLLPFMIYSLIAWTLESFGKSPKRIDLSYKATWALTLLVVIFTIVRNIPNTPFWYFHSDLG